ncbi:MAG: prolipoprotein diacylglyceryl transferase [Candidatus Moraniibacteriota bacterium]
MHDFYQHLPEIISPVAFTIKFLVVRWYSIMYVVGFAIVWLLLNWRIRKGEQLISNVQYPMPNAKETRSEKQETKNNIKHTKYLMQDTILDLMLVVFLGGTVGGRVGYVILYNLTYFLTHPLEIISPYGTEGVFVGLYGMSYHGALLGALLGAYGYTKIKQVDFLSYADFVIPALPLGYFFGRLGNFLNGELVGRETSSWLGMYFVSSQTVLRYPSQIFEALAEGLLLFIVLWKLRNQQKFEKGFLLILYIFSYNIVRFICEFFRNPDSQLGYVFLGLTMGQILSIVSGLILLGLLFLKSKKSAIINLS